MWDGATTHCCDCGCVRKRGQKLSKFFTRLQNSICEGQIHVDKMISKLCRFNKIEQKDPFRFLANWTLRLSNINRTVEISDVQKNFPVIYCLKSSSVGISCVSPSPFQPTSTVLVKQNASMLVLSAQISSAGEVFVARSTGRPTVRSICVKALKKTTPQWHLSS